MKTEHIEIFLNLIDNNFKVTEVAREMNKAQPVISTIIRKLQDKWGVELFVRRGKQIKGLTPVGEQIAEQCREVIRQIVNIDKSIADGQNPNTNLISIATTQTQARFTLNRCVREFREKYPDIAIKFIQGSPRQLSGYVLDGEVDFAFITEQSHLLDSFKLLEIPCFTWKRCLIVHRDFAKRHSLGPQSKLDRIVTFPLISYEFSLDQFSSLKQYFDARKYTIDIAVSATDVEVIKTYVAMQLGVGIIARTAFEEDNNQGLISFGDDLLPAEKVSLVIPRGKKIRLRSQEFIFSYAPHLEYTAIKKLLDGQPVDLEEISQHTCPPLTKQ